MCAPSSSANDKHLLLLSVELSSAFPDISHFKSQPNSLDAPFGTSHSHFILLRSPNNVSIWVCHHQNLFLRRLPSVTLLTVVVVFDFDVLGSVARSACSVSSIPDRNMPQLFDSFKAWFWTFSPTRPPASILKSSPATLTRGSTSSESPMYRNDRILNEGDGRRLESSLHPANSWNIHGKPLPPYSECFHNRMR